MSTGTLMPYGVVQYFDDNGDPLTGGQLFTYRAGSTSPLPTYREADLLTPNSNPVVLDHGGRATIFAQAAAYKLVLYDVNNVLIWSVDNIVTENISITGVSIQRDLMGDPTSPITSLTYPSGATYDKCHAGTKIINFDSEQIGPGIFALEGMMMAVGGGSVFAALVNLTDQPDTPMVTMATNSTTGVLVQSGGIVLPPGGAAKDYGVKVRVSSGAGFVWGLSIRRIG